MREDLPCSQSSNTYPSSTTLDRPFAQDIDLGHARRDEQVSSTQDVRERASKWRRCTGIEPLRRGPEKPQRLREVGRQGPENTGFLPSAATR